MIQIGTTLNVVDNCGAKKAYCIRVVDKSSASIGDLVLVVIKTLRKKRKIYSKVKKGELYFALIVRTKLKKFHSFSDSFYFLENSIVLLNKQHKVLSTRIFGCLPKSFRYTKYMKILAISTGLIS